MILRKCTHYFDEEALYIKSKTIEEKEVFPRFYNIREKLSNIVMPAYIIFGIISIILFAIFECSYQIIIPGTLMTILCTGIVIGLIYLILSIIDNIQLHKIQKEFYEGYTDDMNKALNDFETWINKEENIPYVLYQKAHPQLTLYEAKIILDKLNKM